MKSSTYFLSTSQKWIFAVVITLAILFAGCNDSPTGESRHTISLELPANDLEGYWIELSNNGKMDIAWLNLTNTSGTYEASSADNSNNIAMNFEYEKVNENVLRITMTKHTVNGTVQPTGEEDIFYSLSDNSLRIFDRNFIRAEKKVELF